MSLLILPFFMLKAKGELYKNIQYTIYLPEILSNVHADKKGKISNSVLLPHSFSNEFTSIHDFSLNVDMKFCKTLFEKHGFNNFR